jgi:hypothetical protein
MDEECRALINKNRCAFWIWALSDRVYAHEHKWRGIFERHFPDMDYDEAENVDALQTLLGPTAYAERKAGWERRHSGASEGLLKREIFYTTPGPE